MQGIGQQQLEGPDTSGIDTAQVNYGDLCRNTGFLLRMAWLQVSEKLEENSLNVSLSAPEYTILQMIAQTPGIRQGHLAQALYIKPAAMTRIIRGFEDRALVLREIPQGDRRTVRLSIRPAGRKALEQARALYGGMAEHERGQLSAEEQKQLNQLLRRFCGLDREEAQAP